MRAFSPPQLDRALPRVVIAACCFLLALVAALAIRGAEPAEGAKAKTLGKTNQTPNASCPNGCTAIGSVTAYQTKADGKKQPFKAREDGHVVAWSLDLGKPDKEQKEFFGELFEDNEFGMKSSARLAVLKPQGKSEFKLKSQSPAVQTSSELGREAYYTINDPLRVKKGDVIGVTVPTWSANFATRLSREDNAFRSSRSPKKCSDSIPDVRASKPHEEVGSTRRYGCKFEGSRVLYWAYMVPSGGEPLLGKGSDPDPNYFPRK